MELRLEAAKETWRVGESISVRLSVFNDEFEPRAFDRRLLVGPNLQRSQRGRPPPISVEPAFPAEEQNLVLLNPACLYGRERTFTFSEPGSVTFHGYLLAKSWDQLLPTGPSDPTALLIAAAPLELTLELSSR